MILNLKILLQRSDLCSGTICEVWAGSLIDFCATILNSSLYLQRLWTFQETVTPRFTRVLANRLLEIWSIFHWISAENWKETFRSWTGVRSQMLVCAEKGQGAETETVFKERSRKVSATWRAGHETVSTTWEETEIMQTRENTGHSTWCKNGQTTR